ncbi:MAG: ATP synthase F1 subunit epsilon [Bacteroidales bacterium]|jgi:F-type H+-transporting ATPase subunit epsilon|nr:ATP synthase F1 subunit epsilon [Bacteroidales bacterium]
MLLEVITPEKTIFNGETTQVQMPGIDGLFGVLHNHAPMIAVLGAGKIKIKDENNKFQFIEIKGGVVEVLENKIIVLAD